MIKTIKVVRAGEAVDDYSWAKALSVQQRVDVATQLIQDLWCSVHGGVFPKMDRSVVKRVA